MLISCHMEPLRPARKPGQMLRRGISVKTRYNRSVHQTGPLWLYPVLPELSSSFSVPRQRSWMLLVAQLTVEVTDSKLLAYLTPFCNWHYPVPAPDLPRNNPPIRSKNVRVAEVVFTSILSAVRSASPKVSASNTPATKPPTAPSAPSS